MMAAVVAVVEVSLVVPVVLRAMVARPSVSRVVEVGVVARLT
jgi:hypothetical protein